MSVSGYGERYLNQRDFLSLCSNLEIKNIDGRWLEYLEKEKILFPDLRIKMPKGYAKFVYHNEILEVPKKWKEVHQIFKHFENWKNSDDIFSPIDKNNINSKYLEFPHTSKFRKWQHPINVQNDEILSCQENYYPYWKIYYLFEITKACTLKYRVNLFDTKVVEHIRKKGISNVKLYSHWFPFNYSKYREDFLGKKKEFEILAFYVQSKRRCNTFSIYKFRELLRMNETEMKDFEKRREKRIAQLVKCRNKLTEQETIDFLKFLCTKYFEYESKDFKKLCELIRDDIINQTELIEDGFNINLEDIYNKVGRVRGFYLKNSLEYIFRGDIVKAKEHLHQILKRWIGEFAKRNELLETNESEINKFLKFCEENYMSSLFYDIYRFEYGPWNYYTMNLASFSISFESFLRILKNKIAHKKAVTSLIDILQLFFTKPDLWKTLRDNWTKITCSTKALDLVVSEIEKKEWKEIIKIFLIIGILRNNIAHATFDITFDKKSPHFYFIKIAEAIWYSWSFVQKNLLENEKIDHKASVTR